MTDADRIFHRDITREYPTVVRSDGIFLFDDNGCKYIDGTSGIFVSGIGHNVPEIADAIRAQMDDFSFANTTYFTSAPLQDFSERLIEWAPESFEKVWVCTSGSQANETAIKLARHYHLIRGDTQRSKVVARWHSYHGGSLGALSLTGEHPQRALHNPLLLDFPHINPPYCYRCPYGDQPESCGMKCADELERVVQMVGAEHVSAFIAEPVSTGTLGALVPPPEYFPRIRKICDKYGLLLIADEVVTGIGRTGCNFAVEFWDVLPDIITLGKGLAGGYSPIGAVVLNAKVAGVFHDSQTSLRHTETFVGHVITSVSGLATLQYIEKQALVARVREREADMRRELTALLDLPHVGDVRGRGLLWGIELVAEKQTRRPFQRADQIIERIAMAALSQGLILHPGRSGVDGVNGDNIVLAPPYIISPAQIREMVEIVRYAILAVTG